MIKKVVAAGVIGLASLGVVKPAAAFQNPYYEYEINPVLYRAIVVIDGVRHSCTYYWDGSVECLPMGDAGPVVRNPPEADPGKEQEEFIWYGVLGWLNG